MTAIFTSSATARVVLTAPAGNTEAAADDFRKSTALLFAQLQLDAVRLGLVATVEPGDIVTYRSEHG